MKLVTSLILCSFLLFSCQEEEPSEEYLFEAEVLRSNIDCRIYEIKILKGLSEVEKITGTTSFDSIYIAKNLPDNFKIKGLEIRLDVRAVKNNEISPCTTLGNGYPWLFVKQAIKK